MGHVPVIEWVSPNNQVLSTSGNIVVGAPITVSTSTSRTLLIKVLSMADKGMYVCRSNGTTPSFQLIMLDVQAGFNDCSLNLQHCGTFASCKALDEISVCSCNSGFTLNQSTCHDVDECYLQMHSCPQNTICRNTLGGYDCVCQTGYQATSGQCIRSSPKGWRGETSKGLPQKSSRASKGLPRQPGHGQRGTASATRQGQQGTSSKSGWGQRARDFLSKMGGVSKIMVG